MGQQTTDAYSTFGCKTVLYIHMATLGLFPQDIPMARLHAHTEEKNLSFLSVMCCFQIILGSRKTPKYFTELVTATSLPPRLKSSIGSGLCFQVKSIDLVFNGFLVRHTFSHHPCINFRVLIIRSLRELCKLPSTIMAISSAQPLTIKPAFCRSSTRSFTTRHYKSGDKTPARGQP